MTFKLPDGIPNWRSNAQDWADYAEFLALRREKISLFSICKDPMLVDDELEIDGVEDSTDKYIQKTDEIAAEIQLRMNHLGQRYPFVLLDNGYSLKVSDNQTLFSKVYKYLLLCTRIKMTGLTGSNRIINNIDGALIFEHLCGEVAISFFGQNTELDVFGTSKSSPSNFASRLKCLIDRLGEGVNVKEYPGTRPQDDKVDLVVWKASSDRKSSKFIAFGQCKTGTSWINRLSELDPDNFCKKWFHNTPIVTPVKLFFCAQYFPRNEWDYYARTAGLIFDRFRIVEFLPENLPSDILEKIENWYSGAENQYITSINAA